MGRDEKWFRRMFEQPGDQGGGTATVPEGVDGGWDWGESADAEYAKRFPGGPSEMWKAINEGTQKVSQLSEAAKRAEALEAQLAEIEEERAAAAQEWEDPLQSLPSGADEATTARLVAMFQTDPAGAYDIAAAAAPGYGSVLQNQILVAWFQRDPATCLAHIVGGQISPILDERFQSFEDQLSERLGPTLAHSVEQMSTAAVLTSRTMAPDITKYEDRIEAAILENPALIADVVGNVQKSAQRLVDIRDMLAAADARIAAAKKTEDEAKPDPDPTAKPARPRQSTIARSDAPGPQLVDDDYAKRMSIPKERRRGRGA